MIDKFFTYMEDLWPGFILSILLVAYSLSDLPGYRLIALLAVIPFFIFWLRRIRLYTEGRVESLNRQIEDQRQQNQTRQEALTLELRDLKAQSGQQISQAEQRASQAEQRASQAEQRASQAEQKTLLAKQNEKQKNILVRVLAEKCPEGIAVIGTDDSIVCINGKVAKLSSVPEHLIVGHGFKNILKGNDFVFAVRDILKTGNSLHDVPVSLGEKWYKSELTTVKDDEQIVNVLVKLYADQPFSYDFRDSPFPRPISSASLKDMFSWFFETPQPDDPKINYVAYKCRNDPAYAGNMGISGATEADTGEALYVLVRLINPESAIEVGAYNGASSITISQALKDNGRNGKLHSIEINDTNYALAGKHIAEAGLADFVQQHLGSSQDPKITRLLPKSEFIFIDGDHSYEGAKRDFEIYSELLTDEGIMVYHDTIKIMALRRLVQEITEIGKFATFTLASSDGDGITLIRKRT